MLNSDWSITPNSDWFKEFAIKTHMRSEPKVGAIIAITNIKVLIIKN